MTARCFLSRSREFLALNFMTQRIKTVAHQLHAQMATTYSNTVESCKIHYHPEKTFIDVQRKLLYYYTGSIACFAHWGVSFTEESGSKDLVPFSSSGILLFLELVSACFETMPVVRSQKLLVDSAFVAELLFITWAIVFQETIQP